MSYFSTLLTFDRQKNKTQHLSFSCSRQIRLEVRTHFCLRSLPNFNTHHISCSAYAHTHKICEGAAQRVRLDASHQSFAGHFGWKFRAKWLFGRRDDMGIERGGNSCKSNAGILCIHAVGKEPTRFFLLLRSHVDLASKNGKWQNFFFFFFVAAAVARCFERLLLHFPTGANSYSLSLCCTKNLACPWKRESGEQEKIDTGWSNSKP